MGLGIGLNVYVKEYRVNYSSIILNWRIVVDVEF